MASRVTKNAGVTIITNSLRQRLNPIQEYGDRNRLVDGLSQPGKIPSRHFFRHELWAERITDLLHSHGNATIPCEVKRPYYQIFLSDFVTASSLACQPCIYSSRGRLFDLRDPCCCISKQGRLRLG